MLIADNFSKKAMLARTEMKLVHAKIRLLEINEILNPTNNMNEKEYPNLSQIEFTCEDSPSKILHQLREVNKNIEIIKSNIADLKKYIEFQIISIKNYNSIKISILKSNVKKYNRLRINLKDELSKNESLNEFLKKKQANFDCVSLTKASIALLPDLEKTNLLILKKANELKQEIENNLEKKQSFLEIIIENNQLFKNSLNDMSYKYAVQILNINNPYLGIQNLTDSSELYDALIDELTNNRSFQQKILSIRSENERLEYEIKENKNKISWKKSNLKSLEISVIQIFKENRNKLLKIK